VSVGSKSCWNTSLSKMLVWKTLGIVNMTCSLNFLVRSIIPTVSLTTFLSNLANPVLSVIPTVSNGAVFVLPIDLLNDSVMPMLSLTGVLICGMIFLLTLSVIPTFSTIDFSLAIAV